MPTLLRWLRSLALLAVGGYLAILGLANLVQPPQREIVETIPIRPLPAKTAEPQTVASRGLSTVLEGLPFMR
jgi:hypothetical protein